MRNTLITKNALRGRTVSASNPSIPHEKRIGKVRPPFRFTPSYTITDLKLEILRAECSF